MDEGAGEAIRDEKNPRKGPKPSGLAVEMGPSPTSKREKGERAGTHMKTGDSGAGMKQTDIPHRLSEGTEGNSEWGRKASERPGGVIWFHRKHTPQETQTHSLLCAAFTRVLPGGLLSQIPGFQ